jgi:hypothetical protein
VFTVAAERKTPFAFERLDSDVVASGASEVLDVLWVSSNDKFGLNVRGIGFHTILLSRRFEVIDCLLKIIGNLLNGDIHFCCKYMYIIV